MEICLFHCMVSFIVCCCLNSALAVDLPYTSNDIDANENWHGKWFPQSPDKTLDDNPVVNYPAAPHHDLLDPAHGIRMGIPSADCDDGKINRTLDWNNSPLNYTCYIDRHKYWPRSDIHPILHHDLIPKAYMASHICMNISINYEEYIPTYGPHRPLWAKYGEYLFLPRQRWVHNLEHGAVVMLYHPCANNYEVRLLKTLVRDCLYRHIITPYTLLLPERPLALVTWGNSLEMSRISPKIVVNFIKSMALKGPEQTYSNGQFDYGLLHNAQVVSDKADSNLCPSLT